MFYEKIQQLAHTIVNYSTSVQPEDVVFINGIGFDTQDLVRAVQRETLKAGGIPYIEYEDYQARRDFILNADEDTFRKTGAFLLEQMKQAQVYVGIRGPENVYELADVPKEKLALYNRYIVGPVHIEQRVKHTRWCVMRYPNPAMSQMAQTSTEAFNRFYYDVCTLDYTRMDRAVRPLVELMDRTDRVRIIAPDTDLQFSIRDIKSIKCVGTHNIPDGECFTAPVRNSINGTIRFNTPSVHEGIQYDSIHLTFKNGKVVQMDAGANTEHLRHVLSIDEGASHVGEFALGFNPYILNPMKDTLFDEKIAGSLHMALGQCYEETENGNRSSLHWDLVLIQRPEYGGGEIYFDDQLIRKDGIFTLPELEGLNMENLK
jgi:aminopeptidase